MLGRTLKATTITIGAIAALGWSHASPSLQLGPGSRLWVSGTSTVRSFECAARTLDATVEAALTDAIAAVLSGARGVGAVELRVPAGELDCDNGTMNGHMYKALERDKHPMIVFRVQSYDVTPAINAAALTMQGTLSLGGVEKPITVEATATPGADGALAVAGAYVLNMKDYGLKPPSLMFGAMKVGEKVTVQFELLLKP